MSSEDETTPNMSIEATLDAITEAAPKLSLEQILSNLLEQFETPNGLERFPTETLFLVSELGVLANVEVKARLIKQKAADLAELKIREDKLALEKREFHEFDSKLKDLHKDKAIKLSIGGTFFKTSVANLCKRDPGSFFCRQFSGRWDLKLDEDGALFIDRSPEMFPLILDYLRGKKLPPLSGFSQAKLQDLIEEAKYYQLDGLLLELTPRFDQVRLGQNELNEDKTVFTSRTAGMCYAFGRHELGPSGFPMQSFNILAAGVSAVGLATKQHIDNPSFVRHRNCHVNADTSIAYNVNDVSTALTFDVGSVFQFTKDADTYSLFKDGVLVFMYTIPNASLFPVIEFTGEDASVQFQC